jgi:hypothetical protein
MEYTVNPCLEKKTKTIEVKNQSRIKMKLIDIDQNLMTAKNGDSPALRLHVDLLYRGHHWSFSLRSFSVYVV